MILAAVALASGAAAQTQGTGSASADPCAGDPGCVQASAVDLFNAAEALVENGDLDSAESLLQLLSADPDLEIRTEARFRLAGIRERRGDAAGAIVALRELLAERPDAQRARLELGRILALQGEHAAARREFRQAQAAGLPSDVARTVRRYSTALSSLKRRGVTLDMVVAADSNANRSTGDRFIDTVIAPFELDPDARGQDAPALGISGEAWSRDPLLGVTLLTRAGARGDFFLGKSQFNDVQLSLSSGPELQIGPSRLRPAATYERRWYGGDRYSKGYGAAINWLRPLGSQGQLQADASVVRQSIQPNAALDGTRYAVSLSLDRNFTTDTSGRIAARGALLDARAKPESLRQGGVDALLAHVMDNATVFAQAGYTRTDGRAPQFLFGKTRHDDRFDLIAGVLAHEYEFGGFTPLARLIATVSRSNIALYDFRRVRIEFGLSREF
jgi:tetratricopeptide (TPR) repeat protein